MNLSNKVILVTGGSSGIGEAIVRKCTKYGAKVIFTYISEKDAAEKIASEAGATAVKSDVSSESDCNSTVAQIIKDHGRIDVLVNNAGVFDGAMIDDPKFMDAWKNTIKTDLDGSVYCLRAVTPIMKKQKGGKIINISSIHAVEGTPGGMAYHAAKAAVGGVTRAAAIELAPFGINVNAIAPGAIKTPIWNDIDGVEIKEIEKRIPLKRFGTPEEIAGPVAFLASDESSYMTGQTIFVDGGILINVF